MFETQIYVVYKEIVLLTSSAPRYRPKALQCKNLKPKTPSPNLKSLSCQFFCTPSGLRTLGPSKNLERKKIVKFDKSLTNALFQPQESMSSIPLAEEPATMKLTMVDLGRTWVRSLITTITKRDTTQISIRSPRKTPY